MHSVLNMTQIAQLSSPCYWISQHYNHFSPRDNCKHSRNDNITNHKNVFDDDDHDENDGDDYDKTDDDCKHLLVDVPMKQI